METHTKPTLSDLSQKLNIFFKKYREVNFRKKEIIIRGEEEPEGVYFLKSGYVRFYSFSKDGQEITLNIFKPESYFPISWAVAGISNKYNYEAITDVSVIIAPREDVFSLLKENPDLSVDLIRRQSIALIGLSERMENLAFGTAANKIASVILMLAKRFGDKDGDGTVIRLFLTHQNIANLAALTRETTSIEINKLERQKIIYRKGRSMVVKDLEALENLSL